MQPLAIRLQPKRRSIVAETHAELLDALNSADRLADETGHLGLIALEAANGNALSLVVGGAETVLLFDLAGGTEPRYLSRGASADESPQLECFLQFAERTLLPRWAVIPRELAIPAIEEFAASNELPQAIEWARLRKR
jgi:hypothetical protein